MQYITSTPLAAQAGAIAVAIRAEACHRAAQAGIVATLHALILSALARLVTSLENLLQLWQAGVLPPPAARPAAPRPAPSPDATTPPLRQARARHPSATRHSHARLAAMAGAPAPSATPFSLRTTPRPVAGVRAAAFHPPRPIFHFSVAIRQSSTVP